MLFMKNLILCDKTVRIDDNDSFINITDMWKASGSDAKNQPYLFIKNESTSRFINVLNVKQGYPCLRIQRGGKNPGTWAHKLLAYKYASWIDPEFEVGAYVVLDEFFIGNLKNTEPMHDLQDFTRRMIQHQKNGTFHGRGLSLVKKEKNELIEEGEKLLNRYQVSLF